MAEMDETIAGFDLEERFGEATKEESKQESPGKSVSSEDAREASSVDAKEEDSAETIWEAEEKLLLPGWIRDKKYPISSEEADEQLWEDLREEEKKRLGFLEQTFIKYIFIDVVTRQAYVKMPTYYHEKVVRALRSAINRQSTQARPVLADNIGGMDLTNRSRKYPDVLIFGQDRTEYDKYGELQERTYRFADGNMTPMNPNAIIEVSWTNPIRDELAKFALQMNKYENSDELSDVNVGYLIKFIPLSENNFPTDKNLKRPLVGIDIYRMEAGDDRPAPGDTFVTWRHGEAYPGNLEITREQLGQGIGGEGVSIPFGILLDALDRIGVVFQSPDQN